MNGRGARISNSPRYKTTPVIATFCIVRFAFVSAAFNSALLGGWPAVDELVELKLELKVWMEDEERK